MFLTRAPRVASATPVNRLFAAPSALALNSRNLRACLSTFAGSQRVSDAVKHDHRELEGYYTRLIDSSSHDERVRYQNLFTWELARHSIAEELVVYPAMEHLSGGKEMAERDRHAHQTVKEQLHHFQSLDPSSNEFLPTLKILMKELSQHIKEEEERDLPALEDNTSDDESHGMATSFQRTKHFVPTRSHPRAPDKPPFETVVGLMSAPIDKLMDMLRKFPKD
ncbi:Fc.00g080250.m01.CDS01 [Cosmosporella sp. VM-42]